MSADFRSQGVHGLTELGVPVVVETSRALPLVEVQLCFRRGSNDDAPGDEGRTRLAMRMLRMGTRRLRAPEVEEAVARLGARLGVEISGRVCRVRLTCLSRHLPEALSLVGTLLAAPAFRVRDVALQVRQTRDQLRAALDDDGALAFRALRRHAFGDHAYGRSAVGTQESLKRIDAASLRERYAEIVRRGHLFVGAAGDVDLDTLLPLLDAALAGLPKGRVRAAKVRAPKLARGLRVLVLEREDRTQNALRFGTLGTKVDDAHAVPMLVANAAFGGTFSSTLVREVRGERGWSYSVGSSLASAAHRDLFRMNAGPGADYAAECAALMLELYREVVAGGFSAREVAAARRYLDRGRCFDVDTPGKRLDGRLDVELLGVPPALVEGLGPLLRAVRAPAVRAAIRARLSPRDLSLVTVGDPKTLAPALGRLPGVSEVAVAPFADVVRERFEPKV